MLHNFSFRNFYSFEDWVNVSFRVPVRTPEDGRFRSSSSGQRLSLAQTVLGANGAGKTNVLKAAAFFRWFVCSSFQELKAGERIPYEQFQFCGDSESKPTELVFEFDIEGVPYKYELALTPKRVVRETLYHSPSGSFRYLFKRELDPHGDSYVIRQQGLGLADTTLRDLTRPNASVLSSILQIEESPLKKIGDFFNGMSSNVCEYGRTSHQLAEHMGEILAAAEFFSDNKALREKCSSLLTSLDLGLSRVELKKEKVKSQKTEEVVEMVFPYGIHEIDGASYKLHLVRESNGTQNLFVLLRYLLPVLQTGSVAIIDEFEVDLHPHMIAPILDLFFSSATNPKGAQLLFSCHSVEVLRELDKTQVLLVEKDERCRSEAWRLDEMKGVRRDDNWYAKYLSGAYHAVPRI